LEWAGGDLLFASRQKKWIAIHDWTPRVGLSIRALELRQVRPEIESLTKPRTEGEIRCRAQRRSGKKVDFFPLAHGWFRAIEMP
jgi:hypothetical protein